jgi:tetratricopeptide (TPR) repeat protein
MKMQNHTLRLLALPLLMVLLLASCTRHSAVWPQLLEAEQLLETDFNAAGAMLDSLDATSLEGEEAALYAILKTQADYKRYLPLTSDSLPRLATDYYGTPLRKNYHAAMAWYSLGCYYTDQHADAAAIEVYLRAKELFPDTLSRYHALCYQNIGKHLYLHNMPQQAIPYLKVFHEHPACTSDSLLLANADYCLGVAYMLNRDFREAEKAFYAVLGNRYASNYDTIDAVFQLSKILYHENDNFGASLAFIDKYIAECQSIHQAGALWSLKGDIFYQYNILDSALIYHKRALLETNDIYTRCNSYKQLLNLAPLMNETDSIPFYTEQYTSLLSQIYEQSNTSEMMESKAKHEVEMMSHHRNTLLMIIGGILLVVMSLIIAINSIGRRRRKSSLSSNAVCSSPESKQELIQQCRLTFLENPAVSFLPSDLQYNQPLSLADKKELEQALSKSFAKVDEALRSECADMTPDDALLCMYMLLGLPSKGIATCSRFSTNSISSRKYRLRSKLTPEWRSILFGTDDKVT